MFKLVPIKDFEKSDLNKDPKCHKDKDDGDDEIPLLPRGLLKISLTAIV